MTLLFASDCTLKELQREMVDSKETEKITECHIQITPYVSYIQTLQSSSHGELLQWSVWFCSQGWVTGLSVGLNTKSIARPWRLAKTEGPKELRLGGIFYLLIYF